MATGEGASEPLPLEKKNTDVPIVHVSEPESPEMGKITSSDNHEGQHLYEDEDLDDIGGNEFMSSLSINGHVPDVTGDLLPVPPDGGYGWVIVIAAFMSNLIVDGICNAFSEFKASYSEHFQASDAITALIGSLLIGVYLLVGPIVGGLVNKFGARKVVIIGSIIGAAGLASSVLAPNIVVFMLLYGVVGGIGFGFIYLPAIVVVGFYFESKRAVATGLAVAGSGVGTIIMPMLSEYCIRTIGWKYAVVVLAICVLSCAFFGILYKPLTAPVAELGKEHEMQPLKAALSKIDEDERAPSAISGSPKKAVSSDQDPSMVRLRNALSECDDDTALNGKAPGEESGRSRADSAAKQRPRKNTLTSLTSNSDLKSSRGNLAQQAHKMSLNQINQSLSQLSKRQSSNLSVALAGVDPAEFSRPMNRADIFYGGSVTNLKEFKDEGGNIKNYRGSVTSIPHATIADAANKQLGSVNGDLNEAGVRIGGSRMSRTGGGLTSEDLEDMAVDDSKCKCLPLPVRNAFGEMIDFELLKDPVMLLLSLSNLLGMMGFYIPFVFLKDLAATHNIPGEQSMYLVPVIGVTNTVGRVIFGWLADQGYVTSLTINNFSLITCGILTMICPLLSTFALQMTYAAVFGFIISAYICLTSIVLTDLLGLEKLTNSFGLLVVARGIASLVGSPFAGLVYDITKSYHAAFYFSGFVIILAGLISCAVPFFHRKQRSSGNNEGEYDRDNVSGKLSVLTERSEENLTEYQRTIQSLRQQYALLQEIEDEKKRLRDAEINGIEEVNEEDATDGKH